MGVFFYLVGWLVLGGILVRVVFLLGFFFGFLFFITYVYIYDGPKQSGSRPSVIFSIISHTQVAVLSQWSETSLLALWERDLSQAPPLYRVYSYSQSQVSYTASLPYISVGTTQTCCKKGDFLIIQFFIKYSFSSSLLYFICGFS